MPSYDFELPPRKQPEPPPGQPTQPSRWPMIAVLLLSALVLFQYIRPYPRSTPLHDPKATARPVAPRGDLSSSEQTTIELFEQNSPAVVFITTSAIQQDFSYNLLEERQGSGTGFIWDDAGHVVTNYHVLQNADTARVTLANQKTYKADLVGAEPDKDIAVLKINAEKALLKPIKVGSSSDLKVGQSVFAIGNPFGLDQTLTTGVISGLDREIKSPSQRTIQGVIQTDAAINPGNSGGPLLDSSGRLIGVNTAIYSPSGAYAGVGFAVPVNAVNRIVPELIRHGKVTRPGFGITLVPDHYLRRRRMEGVLINQIMPGSAAEQAGMQPSGRDKFGRNILGDIIIAVDDQKISNQDDLFKALDGKNVGDTVQVTVLRGDQKKKLEVKLQAL